MSEILTFLPQYESNPEYNAELLRQSIPLMMKNNISTHPINYAIWYEYVAGNNGQLNKAVDQLVKNNQSFDENTSLHLYKTHICNASVDTFEEINTNLQKLLDTTTNSVQNTSNKVSDAGENFKARSTQLAKIKNTDDMEFILSSILTETKQLTEITHTLKTQLDDAHDEMDQLRLELSKVKVMATTDSLTGLLNRRAFDTELINLIENPAKATHCLLILDLDHFKKVNDSFGHLVGDKVIRYTAGLLKKHTAEHHHTARYGGEEMAIIMPNTELNHALEIAETIRTSLSKSQLKQKDNGQSIGIISVSIGVTTLKANDDFDSFIARADEALYNAKESGRNRVMHR